MDKERNSHKHTEGTASASLLSIRGLSAAYDGRTVLHDVNLEVYERDFLGIIGPNGGGKTTLIKCILGLLRPTGGEIVKHHEPLTTGYLHSRAKRKRQAYHRPYVTRMTRTPCYRAAERRTTATRPAGTRHHQRPATAHSRRTEHLYRQALRSPPLPVAGRDQPRLRHHPCQPRHRDGAATGEEHRLCERNTGLPSGRKRQHRMAGTEFQLPHRAVRTRHAPPPGAGPALPLPRERRGAVNAAAPYTKTPLCTTSHKI